MAVHTKPALTRNTSHLAEELLAGKRVASLFAGEAQAEALIARTLKQRVTAIDLVRPSFPRDEIDFYQGDVRSLGLRPEHHHQYDRVLLINPMIQIANHSRYSAANPTKEDQARLQSDLARRNAASEFVKALSDRAYKIHSIKGNPPLAEADDTNEQDWFWKHYHPHSSRRGSNYHFARTNFHRMLLILDAAQLFVSEGGSILMLTELIGTTAYGEGFFGARYRKSDLYAELFISGIKAYFDEIDVQKESEELKDLLWPIQFTLANDDLGREHTDPWCVQFR